MLYYQSLAPAKKQNGIDPEQPEKRFLFQMRHRLNRKLFFRPCQYIRERKQRRETKTGAASLSFVIFLEGVRRLYLHSGSVLSQTDRRVLSFSLLLFFQLITGRRILPVTGVCVPLLFCAMLTKASCVFLLPVYLCHQIAAAHFGAPLFGVTFFAHCRVRRAGGEREQRVAPTRTRKCSQKN
jgi:hypothetical protein